MCAHMQVSVSVSACRGTASTALHRGAWLWVHAWLVVWYSVCVCACASKVCALISALLHTQTAGEQSVTDKAGSSLGRGSGEGTSTLRPAQGQSPNLAPAFLCQKGQAGPPCCYLPDGREGRAGGRVGWMVPRKVPFAGSHTSCWTCGHERPLSRRTRNSVCFLASFCATGGSDALGPGCCQHPQDCRPLGKHTLQCLLAWPTTRCQGEGGMLKTWHTLRTLWPWVSRPIGCT